ncbi:hypothetical protein L198_00791 [Cryptococcus wingfieldii CBS 7118]|uniref:WLM domain-containing protein n=1 Tax=Cryptococcus wingfieldii CBS 7118 TaxID=1295528 RepID=A0A1E3K4P1_9TREE|nr:hypothetical protein L198_00791 [Cryptococcus wingfieldii CBS 7118]ODO07212.1 hypothetical protein L198_00791 [Cryptococcus wingfieldii CBS 7118]
MQAPRLRLNEREANPNPYVIFIRPLMSKKDYTDAEDILKAVGKFIDLPSSAQMRTIMKERFMQVGTLEEAAFNRVFAGRNWNHGQSIELVLRGPSGRFLPLPYIISVMCHEMAHIQQMNHGPNFQKLMNDIKADVGRLQARGYYGDGFWSDGKRLKDSVRMGGEGLRASDFPEYVCGVSASDAKKARRAPRRPASSGTGLVKGEASHLSGRQTEYKRKAGRRNNADMGETGARLDGVRAITKADREDRKAFIDEKMQTLADGGMAVTRAKKTAGEMWEEENPWWIESNTRSKVAKSKTAANLRAEAAEARLRALAGPSKDIKPKSEELQRMDDSDESGADEIQVVEDPHLSIEERKRDMEEDMDEEEMNNLRGGWEDFITGDERPKVPEVDKKRQRSISPGPLKQRKITTAKHQPLPRFSADLVREERLRALGLSSSSSGAGRERTLGSTPASETPSPAPRKDVQVREDGTEGWSCAVCTFINLMDHGRCEMCQARPDGTIPEN